MLASEGDTDCWRMMGDIQPDAQPDSQSDPEHGTAAEANNEEPVAPCAPLSQEVQNIGKEALDSIIGNSVYEHVTTSHWSQKAVETITTNLVKLNKPYKYIVTCVIMQTNAGAGLSVSSTCYWDKATDLAYTVRWENKSLVTIVNVFAVGV